MEKWPGRAGWSSRPRGSTGRAGRDGSQGPAGRDGVDGLPGRSIETAVITPNGDLLLGLSDSSIINVGRAVGPVGPVAHWPNRPGR